MNNRYSTEEFKTVTLDKIRQKMQVRFNPAEMERMGIDLWYDTSLDALSVRVERWFVGQHMPEVEITDHKTVKVRPVFMPRGWIQHFKHDYCDHWWMRWIVNIWPIVYDEIPVDDVRVSMYKKVAFDVIYPDFEMPCGMEADRKIIMQRYIP